MSRPLASKIAGRWKVLKIYLICSVSLKTHPFPWEQAVAGAAMGNSRPINRSFTSFLRTYRARSAPDLLLHPTSFN